MKLHANARLSLKGRELLIDRVVAGSSLIVAAEAVGITERTARKWIARHQAEGPEGLLDRSCAAHTVASRSEEQTIDAACGGCDS